MPDKNGNPVPATIEGGKALPITKARIKIGDEEQTGSVSKAAKNVKFRLRLAAGETRLYSWFTGEKGEEWGAYFVYVRRVST